MHVALVWNSLSRQRNNEKSVATENSLSRQNFFVARACTLLCAQGRLGMSNAPGTLSPYAALSQHVLPSRDLGGPSNT